MQSHLFRTKQSRFYIFLTVMGTSFLTGCSYFFPEKVERKYFSRQALKEANFPEILYQATLTVHGAPEYDSYFQSIPKLLDREHLPPTSKNALRYRAEIDLKRLRQAMKNKGYFDGVVGYTLQTIGDMNTVSMTLTAGARYRIGNVLIEIEGAEDHDPRESLMTVDRAEKVINIQTSEYVELDQVILSVANLKKYFQNKGYPFVDVLEPTGQINQEHKTLTLEYKIILNGQKNFGDLHISGLTNLSPAFVRNRIHFHGGERYDSSKIDQAQRDLLDTELFSSISFAPDLPQEMTREQILLQKNVPLHVSLLEAPPRAIGVGLRYATQEGVGGKVYWQHRNLWGNGEKFMAKLECSQLQIDGILSFEKPDFYFPDLTLESKLDYSRAHTKAFHGDIYRGYMGLRHRWNDELTYWVGNSYEYSLLKQNDSGKSNAKKSFIGVPLSAVYNLSNDVLNPYKGWKTKWDITSYFGDIGQRHYMVKTSLYGAHYWQIVKKDKFIVATWGRIGHIFATPLDKIPLNQRFYSGGSNSVRGYGFQKLGPISAKGKPTGGQTQFEGGIEPRLRIGENLGASVFVEAGQVSSKKLMQRTSHGKKHSTHRDQFLVGYGVGLKYYTEIGPLRLDVALPIQKRRFKKKKYDAPFQLYMSIGQAF